MKKLAALITILISSSAFGVLYTDSVTHSQTISKGDSPAFSYVWNYGPIGTGETITSIKTTFGLKDLNGPQVAEDYSIRIGLGPILDFQDLGVDIDLALNIVNLVVYNFDSSFNAPAPNGDWSTLTADASDGNLKFNIQANNSLGDPDQFELYNSKIEIYTATPSVPDSGTSVALLGLALFGLGAFARRIRR